MALTVDLRGQTALVTGAGRGLGRAVAMGLARAGAAVWISARTQSELETTADQIAAAGGVVTVRRTDLADANDCAALAGEIISAAGAIDVLVNNAAVLQFLTIGELSLETWAQTMAINLTAPFLLTRAVLPGMRRRGGSIINVSSRAGVMPFARESAYCASKFGLEGLTRSVAEELHGLPISINTVTPGLRIKPTSITDQDVAGGVAGAETWNDPALIVPAFLYLAARRGDVTGQRFDAQRLTSALASPAALTPERVLELTE